jgi:hypothetical protein
MFVCMYVCMNVCIHGDAQTYEDCMHSKDVQTGRAYLLCLYLCVCIYACKPDGE